MPSLDVAINSLRAKHGADQFDSAVRKIQTSATKVDKSVAKVDKGFNTLGTTMGKLGKVMVGFVGFYAVSRYLKSSIKELAAYEKQLAEVSTMLDDQTMRYLPQYKEELADLAIEYGESTEALSRGLYDILSASIDAADALDVLEVATKAAKAGLTDTGTAADAITTVLNSYSMEAEEAGRVSDILFATVKRGKTTFGQLAPSIGKVTSLAASAGLSIEEVAAALATMTRAGVQTDIAITSLKGILTTFLAPQQKSVDVAKKWGIELNTNTLRTKGLTGVVRELKTMNQESVASIFSNVRALTGLSALLQQSEGHTSDLAIAMSSLGMTEDALDKMMDNTSTKLNQLNEAWKRLKRESVEGWSGEIDAIIESLTWLGPKIGVAGKSIDRFLNLQLPEAVHRWKAAFHDFREELWDGIVIEDAVIEREKILAETHREAADAMFESVGASKAFLESVEAIRKEMEDLPPIVSQTTDLWGQYTNSLIGVEGSMAAVIPPSEELTAALVDVEDKIAAIQTTIDQFGMTTFEKQIQNMEKLGKGLSASELAKFNVEMDKLRAKGAEADQLKVAKQAEVERERRIHQEWKAVYALRAQTEEMKFEMSLIGLSNEEREKAIASQKRLSIIQGTSSKNAEFARRLADGYEQTAHALAEATAEHERFLESQAKEAQLLEEKKYAKEVAQELIREVELEKGLLILTNEERERAIKLQRLEADTKILGAEASAELVEQYRQELIELQKAQEVAKIAGEIRDGMGELVRAPLDALLDNTADLGEMLENRLKDMGKNILQAWYDQMITQKMQQMAMSALFGAAGGGAAGTTGMLGSIFAASAKGNAFDRGRLVPMRNGGILDTPTVIPLKSGAAIAAEEKPEAVMPLTRIGGKLGVESTGSSATVNNNITNVLDPGITGEYLDSGEGEQQIVNIIRRNRNAIEVQ
jgi:TP901 family phage tail tape measure protein